MSSFNSIIAVLLKARQASLADAERSSVRRVATLAENFDQLLSDWDAMLARHNVVPDEP